MLKKTENYQIDKNKFSSQKFSFVYLREITNGFVKVGFTYKAPHQTLAFSMYS